MTFEELKDELFARGTNYLEEDATSEARAERWLNQSYREILNLHAWPFLQTTQTGVADDGFVSVPDLRKIRFVQDVSESPARKLDRVSLDDLASDGEDLAETGTPDWYYVDGGNIVRSFPLGGTIKVYYIKRVDPLSGSSSPIFDEEYHNLIVDKAMILAHIDNDNYEAAGALQAIVNQRLIAMSEDYLLDSRDVQFIQVDPYDG